MSRLFPTRIVRGLFAWALVPLLFLAVSPGHATQPLHDILHVDEREGAFFPEGCCWVDMPPSERLRAAKRAEACSAIGGPVGRFQLWEGHVWLIGLRRCGADVPLEDIYPEMTGPALATWLTGRFRVMFDRTSCLGDGWVKPVYRTIEHLVIDQGRVVDTQTETADLAGCSGH